MTGGTEATQGAAAKYAEIVLTMARQRTLSGFILTEVDLSRGTFSWEVEPELGDDGEWYDATWVAPELRGRAALLRLLTPLVVEGSVSVIEEPMLLSERPSYPIRTFFKTFGNEIEALLFIEPSNVEEAAQTACGIVVGAYYFVGIVTRTGVDDLPDNGADVSDEQIREWVRGTTHFIFRGPSYDSYVLWTASG